MSHPFDTLVLEDGAKFIFTPCPGTKETTVSEAVETLKNAGADAIISAMFDDELAAYQATTLGSVCADQQLEWFQLPLIDDGAPDEAFDKAWQENKQAIIALIKANKTLAVHCRGGSGRTGLVVALILLAMGYSKIEAKNLVQSIRPLSLSKTYQLNYFEQY